MRVAQANKQLGKMTGKFGLLVKGDCVGPELANRILIRTGNWPHNLRTTDKSYEAQFYSWLLSRTHQGEYQIAKGGIEHNNPPFLPETTDLTKAFAHYPNLNRRRAEHRLFVKALNQLPVRIFSNFRIAHSGVYGPNGWIDWMGNIQAAHYSVFLAANTVKQIWKEWSIIAQAFPELNLQVQILDHEISYQFNKVMLQFRVKDGEVKFEKPASLLLCPDLNFADLREAVLSDPTNPSEEVAISFDTLISIIESCIFKDTL